MDWNSKLRRAFNVILDAVSELKIILTEKEKISVDKGVRSRFEREMEKIGENIARTKIRHPVLKTFKDIRNSIAHMNTVDHHSMIESVTLHLPELQEFSEHYIQQHFSENHALKTFEKFGVLGTPAERSKMIDALYSQLTERDRVNWATFPKDPAIAKFSIPMEAMINHPELKILTQENETIALQVTEDIIGWAKDTQKLIAIKAPYAEELELLQQTKVFSDKNFFENYEGIAAYLKDVYINGEINFSFFDKKLNKLDKKLDLERIIKGELKAVTRGKVNLKGSIEKFIESSEFDQYQKDLPFTRENYNSYAQEKAREVLLEARALQANFINDWEQCLREKIQAHEIAVIEQSRQMFVDQLYTKISDFRRLRELLEPFTRDVGRLWDLSSGVWHKSGFELLEKFAKLLEKDVALKSLADMLGRYRKDEKEFEEAEMKTMVIRPKFRPRRAAKGEMIGIRESDDISSMLPIETAILSNEKTRPLFLKKFAEKKLATYDFRNRTITQEEEEQTKNEIQERESKGPIIMCIDTSGSMRGVPEQVAKTICFALMRIAWREKRKCFLISFSTQIHTIDLTEMHTSLDHLVEFLGMSFNGGTDANPAFVRSLEMLEEEDYHKADILMVSDFAMDTLEPSVITRITLAKESGTKFYSLVISRIANDAVIEHFDHSWTYSTDRPDQNVGLINRLRSL